MNDLANNTAAPARISPLKLAVAKSVGAVSRASGRGGGTSLPGKVLLRLQDDAITRLGAALEGGTIVISATNGKTTTAAMLASVLEADGRRPVHNSAGANMAGGVATALLESWHDGRPDGDTGLFEVDEAWTERMVAELQPDVVVLANLFRDQLDRYGELEKLADSWQSMVHALPPETRVVLNADDPLLAMLGAGRDGTLYFGIDDPVNALPELLHAADSKHCRACGAALTYEAVQLGHLGSWHCDACGAARPNADIAATAVELRGMEGSHVTIATPAGDIGCTLPLPGLYNVYNAVAATAAAFALGVGPEPIRDGLASARAVFGRVETIDVGGQPVAILLIKNPTGANEVVRTIAAERQPFDLWIALNDRIADGRDVSWIWDADFERLAGRTRMVTCSGTRAEEMALRLAYAGVDPETIRCDRHIEQSFDSAVAGSLAAGTKIFALPTYTSLLELRTAIARRGEAAAYWERGGDRA